MSAPTLLTPLHTDGAKILDADGNTVKLASVNVSGFPLFHEQWTKGHTLQKMLDAVRQLGFNSIRLPISSQLFIDPKLQRPLENPNEFDYCWPKEYPYPKTLNRCDILVNHPELASKSAIEMLDAFITEAGKRGLSVILDLHQHKQKDEPPWTRPELWYQTGSPNDESDTRFLGFNDPRNNWTNMINEPTVITLWEALAEHYKDNRTIIGYDLFNEPHGRATWGDGGPTDWRRAAILVGTAIQNIDKTKLIFVEGIGSAHDVRVAWDGGNLHRAWEFPVYGHLQNVVYSPHDYGPSVAPNFPKFWLSPKINPSAMREIWEREWGYLARNNVAPIWVGELGQPNLSAEDPGGQQVRQLLDYLHEIGAHFSYWVLHDGGSADTGGLIVASSSSTNPYAYTIVPGKLEVLQPYLTPVDATFGSGIAVYRNGFVPNYEPFDTTQQPDFPPAPRDAQGVPIPRPTVVRGPDQSGLERRAA